MDAPTRENQLSAQYDAEQDILYFLFGTKAQKALAEEMEDEVFVRYDPETRKVISIEFLNFNERITNIFGQETKYVGSERPERLLIPMKK